MPPARAFHRRRPSVTPALGRAILAALVMFGALLQPAVVLAESANGVPGAPRIDAANLDAGERAACGIVASGTVRCWGVGSSGQLAQGNTDTIGDNAGESTVPVSIGAGHFATSVSFGAATGCVIDEVGTVHCWGLGIFGQLAQGNTATLGDGPGEPPVTVDLGPGRTAKEISVGYRSACAILDTGALLCWGANESGELAQGDKTNVGDTPAHAHPVRVDLGPGRTATAVSVGSLDTCAILDTGVLRCWGKNAHGELGQGNTNVVGDGTSVTNTVAVDLGPGRTAKAVAVGLEDVCAILDDGALRCWGNNDNGQLAQGNVVDVGDDELPTAVPPVDLGPGRRAIAVSQSFYGMCVVVDDGTLRCAGWPPFGEFGQGNTTKVGNGPGPRTVAVPLGGRKAVSISGGEVQFCAGLDDSTLKCWGAGNLGQLGQGSAQGWGANSGETPDLIPGIKLGGELAGLDRDGDGVRDSLDLCPAIAATGQATGCVPPPTPTPTPMPPPAATPAPTITPAPGGTPAPAPAPKPVPEALLSGKTILINATLTRTAKAKRCPASAVASVRVSGKRRTGKLKVAATTVAGKPACKATGAIRLLKAASANAKLTVSVTGTGLTKRSLPVTRS